MALVTLSDSEAEQGSTFFITATWTKKDGSACTPDSATWTLTDKDGTVVNSRQDVSISVPSTSNEIALSGDDLGIGDEENLIPRGGRGTKGDFVERFVTFEAVYDEDADENYPLVNSCKFWLRRVLGVALKSDFP